MQSIQNIEEKIFLECKEILAELLNLETPNDLLQQFQSIVTLHEKTMLLKNLDLIQGFAKEENAATILQKDTQISDLEEAREKLQAEYWQILEEKNAEITVLASQLRNEKYTPSEEIEIETPKDRVENILLGDYESQMPETNSPVEEIAEIISDNPEDFQEQNDFEKDNISAESIELEVPLPIIESIENTSDLEEEPTVLNHEHLRDIVDIEKKQSSQDQSETVFEDLKSETVLEKKFRLGKIKGLSMVKSLFDDDLEDLTESPKNDQHPLQNNNMATGFMEAEKPKLNFRVDLNDKVAFTKLLFKGDEDELRNTVNRLNEYKTLDEAKEYLSELYYTKEWEKVDEYAQRLWVLVENKFV